jgi:hypothetical protein
VTRLLNTSSTRQILCCITSKCDNSLRLPQACKLTEQCRRPLFLRARRIKLWISSLRPNLAVGSCNLIGAIHTFVRRLIRLPPHHGFFKCSRPSLPKCRQCHFQPTTLSFEYQYKQRRSHGEYRSTQIFLRRNTVCGYLYMRLRISRLTYIMQGLK